MKTRTRSRRYADLPPNLYANRIGGRVYYRYRRPDNGTMHSMGVNKAEAMNAARQLNSLLNFSPDIVSKVMGETTMADVITRFRKEWVPDKVVSDSTAQNLGYRLDRFTRDLGAKAITSFTVKVVADYLDENFKNDPYIKHRGTLVELFAFARTKGLYLEPNPAEETRPKSTVKKERQRFTLKTYRELYASSPEWMQIAMDISILTLQGRNEVVNMRFDDYDEATHTLTVVRQKSEKHEHSHLKIYCPRMAEIIKRARQSDIASPFIVHRIPKRKKHAKDRKHWTQLTLNDFSAKIREQVDKCGAFDHLTRAEKPTFHEIRALGSWLYKKQGFENDGYVQQLMAHKEKETTELYQDGFEQSWMQVRAELDLDNLDKVVEG